MNRINGDTIVRLARRHPRQLVLMAACLAVLVWLLFLGTDRATSKYWNEAHALSRQAGAAKNVETPAETIAALIDVEERLAAFDTAGVDARALASVNQFRVAVGIARQCIEEGQRILDHPVRTKAKIVTYAALKKEALRDLREQIVHLREVMVEAHEFSVDAHRRLSHRYPLSSFEPPIPPDLAQVDKTLRELKRIDQESKDMIEMAKRAFEIGMTLGGLAGALFGG